MENSKDHKAAADEPSIDCRAMRLVATRKDKDMTDRELLVLAAMAAGIADGDVFYDMEREQVWNPLTDDGDALRLAVKLHMLVDIGCGGCSVRFGNRHTPAHSLSEFGDPSTATRRAIVQAAAEIAKIETPNAELCGGEAVRTNAGLAGREE